MRDEIRARLIWALPLVCLAGCTPAYLEQRSDGPPNAADVVRSADLRPQFPISAHDRSVNERRRGGFTQLAVPGSPVLEDAPPDTDLADAKVVDGFMLNFENAPVANVVKAVLGDLLGLRYTIDPRVQGTITLSSSRAIAKRELLFVLESGLRADNLVLLREAGGYRVAPMGEGGAFGPTDRTDSAERVAAGYGMTVVPMHYVSAPTIARLLEGFSTRPGTVRGDPSGRLLLVTGSGEERRAALETVRQFDVDWMLGQSVGLYPIHNGASSTVTGELEKIMDSGESGLGHGLVKIQDVSAQNAVLVVSARPSMLIAASRWIQRLDNPNASGTGVHVYKVQYGEAKQLAQMLNSMFGSDGGTGETDGNQLAPNAGNRTLSPADRLIGGHQLSGATVQSGVTNPPSGDGANAANDASGVSAGPPPFGGLQVAALNSAFAEARKGGGTGPTFPRVRITADVADNSLLIYASPDNYSIVERALQQIDRPKAQVAIDVTIAEVTLNDQLNYGVQFYLANLNMASVGNTTTGQPLAGTGAGSGFNLLIGQNATPHVIINALHQLTDVKILSNPSLMVLDNQEATLEVGDQVPVSTGSATVLSANNAVVNTIDYKNTGIILDVIPRVGPDNSVQLDISQEISNVVDGTTVSNSSPTTNGATTPTISERKVKSQITVANGEMVMLAGLVAETQSKSRSGIPGLDQFPLVGGAFGSTGGQRLRTELIILIKPQIVHNSVDASRVAEELRAKMRGGRVDATSFPNALQIGAKAAP